MRDIEPLRRTHVSTKAFPESKRLALWREIYGRGISNFDIRPIGDSPFHADVTFDNLPGVGIASGSRSPAHYIVTRELAGRGKDVVVVSVLRSGTASATQFGKEVVDGVGSACVLTPTDPSTSTLHTDGSFTTLALSRPAIAALVPDLSLAFGRPISRHNAALGLLTRYLDILQASNDLANPELEHSISDHILDLAALALGARGDRAELARHRGGQAARLSAIRADILSGLGSGYLSTESIAARHGISARYVRKLFEQDGSSFSSFVLAQRLARAHRMLLDRRYAHLSIARIAGESGFGDVSYFNRVFRRRFGATPSDLRAAARAADHE
jgi:AraC-like DNA-binding protein